MELAIKPTESLAPIPGEFATPPDVLNLCGSRICPYCNGVGTVAVTGPHGRIEAACPRCGGSSLAVK